MTRLAIITGGIRGLGVAISRSLIATEMVVAMPKDALARIEGQIPVGRLGTPDDIARIVRFLVSDAEGFITGATISANGGQTMV